MYFYFWLSCDRYVSLSVVRPLSREQQSGLFSTFGERERDRDVLEAQRTEWKRELGTVVWTLTRHYIIDPIHPYYIIMRVVSKLSLTRPKFLWHYMEGCGDYTDFFYFYFTDKQMALKRKQKANVKSNDKSCEGRFKDTVSKHYIIFMCILPMLESRWHTHK